MNGWPNETPTGQLGRYLIGDLGVAYRHVARLLEGTLPATPAVLAEIKDSLQTCIRRIERDILDGGRTE